jgi:hypothetical protein
MPSETQVADVAEPTLSGPVSADAGCFTVVGAANEDHLVSYLVDFYRKAQIAEKGPSTIVFGTAALLRKIETARPDGIEPHLWLVELSEKNPRFAPAPNDPMSAAMGRHNSSLNIYQRLIGEKSCLTAKEVHAQSDVGKHVAGGAIAPTVDALFEGIATDLLADPAADVQWLMLRSTPRVRVYFEGNSVTDQFRQWWDRQPHLEKEVAERVPTDRVPIPDGPILFGLEAQGHIPTIEAALEEGVNWQEIGRRILWDGETARQYYERHVARQASKEGLSS